MSFIFGMLFLILTVMAGLWGYNKLVKPPCGCKGLTS